MLLGCLTDGKFVNGGSYEVTQVETSIVHLKDLYTGQEFQTTPDTIANHTLLKWAMTYHRLQGSTEKGTMILHDLTSRYIKRAHLYVGLSRVTDGNNVYLADD